MTLYREVGRIRGQLRVAYSTVSDTVFVEPDDDDALWELELDAKECRKLVWLINGGLERIDPTPNAKPMPPAMSALDGKTCPGGPPHWAAGAPAESCPECSRVALRECLAALVYWHYRDYRRVDESWWDAARDLVSQVVAWDAQTEGDT